MEQTNQTPAATTTALARPQPAPASITPFEPDCLERAIDLADRIAKSGLIPDALKGKPQDVLVQMMTGREYGLGVMQSIRGISVIKGTPSLRSELLVGLILSKPDCEFFDLVESTDKIAVYSAQRTGRPAVRMAYRIEDAERANLIRKNSDGSPGMWAKYPAQMLRARAAKALAIVVFPHHTMGLVDDSEIEEVAGQPAEPAAQTLLIAKAMEQVAGQPKPASAQVVEGQVVKPPFAAPVEDAVFQSAPPVDVPSLLGRIGSASEAELEQLISEVQKVPEAQRPPLREAYKARKSTLAGPKPKLTETLDQIAARRTAEENARVAEQIAKKAPTTTVDPAQAVEREPGAEG